MTDPKDPKAPEGKPTTPGMQAVRESAPPADFRVSNTDSLTNAPPWVAQILARFDEAQAAEREAREQAHRAASRISAAFLKTEATVELTRQAVLGCRSDVRELRRDMDRRFEEQAEEHARERKETATWRESIERRIAALEAKDSG